MDAKQTDKTCKNCKYYVAHYVILKSMQLSHIDGHCKFTMQKKKPIEPTDCCVHWERKENLSAAAQKTLSALLRDTEKRLKQIQLILSLIDK